MRSPRSRTGWPRLLDAPGLRCESWREHVVAGDRRDPHAAEAKLPGDVARVRSAAATGFAAPILVTIRMPLRAAERQHRAQPVGEQGIVAGRRVLELCLLGQRDGALGEALEDQVVEIALLGQLDGRLDPVAGIARACADPDLFHPQSKDQARSLDN